MLTTIRMCFQWEKQMDKDEKIEYLNDQVVDYQHEVHMLKEKIKKMVKTLSEKGLKVSKKRFNNNGDGTVTDTTTGLVWLRDPADYNVKPQEWQEAIDGCKNFSFAGYKDWRLPAAQELFNIVDFTKKKYPLINDVFICPEYTYWTTQEYVSHTIYAMLMYFNTGGATYYNKTNAFFVRPVRGDL